MFVSKSFCTTEHSSVTGFIILAVSFLQFLVASGQSQNATVAFSRSAMAVGESVAISCKVDSTLVKAYPIYGFIEIDIGTGTLHFPLVATGTLDTLQVTERLRSSMDNGKLHCAAIDSISEIFLSTPITLVVKAAPTAAALTGPPTWVQAGTRAIFRCSVLAGEPPFIFHFYFNSKLRSRVSSYTLSTSYAFTLSAVDFGKMAYCNATSIYGSSASSTIPLKVYGIPTTPGTFQTLPAIPAIPESMTYDFECKALDPAATYCQLTDKRNNVANVSIGSSGACVFNRSPAVATDEGIYECKACNLVGCSPSFQIFLKVKVNGGWSAWRRNSTCSTLESRTCTNPSPRHGGSGCPAPSHQLNHHRDRACSWDVGEPQSERADVASTMAAAFPLQHRNEKRKARSQLECSVMCASVDACLRYDFTPPCHCLISFTV